MTIEANVERLIYHSSALLDETKYTDYMNLCDPEFRYQIVAYSPEIKQNMTWLDHDHEGMSQLIKNLPRHNTDPAALTRHLTVYSVDIDESENVAHAVSALQVFRTDPDGGATTLYAVGKQYDTINLKDGEPKLLARTIQLQTRQLGIGHHVPF